MKTVTVEIRNVYGNETIYPICEQAKLLAKLAGTKTITKDAVRVIKDLGYSITVKNREL